MKFRRKYGGYYLNVGCSDLLINGDIALVQYANVKEVADDGIKIRNGTVLEADLIVLGTGYQGQETLIAQLFGEEMASRVGPIWGLDGEGEFRNVWRPTAQRGLWFMAGSLLQCRFYSRVLALENKATEEGIEIA